MSKVNWNKYEFIDYINYKRDEIDNLPQKLSISTMCATASLKSLILLSPKL